MILNCSKCQSAIPVEAEISTGECLAAVCGNCGQNIILTTREDKRKKTREPEAGRPKPLGWLLTLVVPGMIYLYLSDKGLGRETVLFAAICSISLVMWIFKLLPDFIPGLFAILLFLLFGLAPTQVVLSGFSSTGFLLAFSVLGLGSVISSSGLTRRFSLFVISILPANTFWYKTSLFMTGLLFTPIVPSITGRASIVAPALNEIVKGCDRETRQRSSTMLYAGGLDGINFLSAIFLTSAPANFIIFGMLPPQEQQAFQFVYWAFAASVAGLIMFGLYFLTSALFFRSYRRNRVSKDTVVNELKNMGPLSWNEWFAIIGILVLGVGIATTSFHKIEIPFIAFTVLFSLLFIEALDRKAFIGTIDWAFLFLLASMIGLLSTMNYLQIDQLITSKLDWLGNYMRHDFKLFILILSGLILLVRLIVPMNTAIIIFAASLLPLAVSAGISVWLVGFIILIMAETSIFSYQAPYNMFFRNLTRRDVEINPAQVRIFHALLIFVKLLAIYASIPFWIKIGVL